MAASVVSVTHSTKPSPRVLSDVRKLRTSSDCGTRSWIDASIARSLISEPPGASTKSPLGATWPALSSVIWGRLGDRIGYRRLLIAMALGAGLIYIPQGFVVSVVQLIVLRGILGIFDGE